MVGNFVLWHYISRAVKHNLRPQNQQFTSTDDNFQCSYPHSNALFHLLSCPNVLLFTKVKQCQRRKNRSDVGQWKVMLDFRQYIAWYTVSNFWRHPIKRCVIFASTLELLFHQSNISFPDLIIPEMNVNHNKINISAWAWQNQQNNLCAQPRLRSAWASVQSEQMDGWVRVLRPFNSISVISRRWKGEHERLCAMKRRLGSGRISPPAGFEPATPWSEVGSANRSATRTLQSEQSLPCPHEVTLGS